MRRIVALASALLLTLSLAGSSLADVAHPNGNFFHGNFDMTNWDGQQVVAHVTADISEPSDAKLVPGTVDIYWRDGRAVRESHAQLFHAEFWDATWADPYSPTGYWNANMVMVLGSLCDYTSPQNGSCEPFAMVFQQITNGGEPTANKVGFSVRGTMDCCGGDWWPAGQGAWVLNYNRPTLH